MRVRTAAGELVGPSSPLVFDVNLYGCCWMAEAFARACSNGGFIINIPSVIGLRSSPLPQAAYACSKAALIGLTRDLDPQWSVRKGVRVTARTPGFFESEMTSAHEADVLAAIASSAPLGRIGRLDDLAATIVWLASDASSYTTGATTRVDGGLVMYSRSKRRLVTQGSPSTRDVPDRAPEAPR